MKEVNTRNTGVDSRKTSSKKKTEGKALRAGSCISHVVHKMQSCSNKKGSPVSLLCLA